MARTQQETGAAIAAGKTAIGLEFGSTRIKAVLIGEDYAPLASGGYDWENRLEDGFWTYRMDDVWEGARQSFRALSEDALRRYGVPIKSAAALGISAMMHGYLVFDGAGGLLAPFRTWRNTTTERAAAELSERFSFNMPLRWSAAHLYQAILNGETHVKDAAYLTTLAGYVHWRLSGKKVLGVGDASGMFPIDGAGQEPGQGQGQAKAPSYDRKMAEAFDAMALAHGFSKKITDIMPRILVAGDDAGALTEEGARLLDPSGGLSAGIPMCAPEGDAGTGMVATNSVAPGTGNVSAGTSIFAMAVLSRPLSKVHAEIDMVATPAGLPCAMAHCNNCTSDLDAWARLFMEAASLFGPAPEKPALYDALYAKALEGEPDCGGLLPYNYVSGEPVTGFEEGRPLLARMPGSRFSLANLMRAHLFSAMAALKIGMDILVKQERAPIERLTGHGGLFKTPGVGQRLMAAALSVPVAVMDSAGEGGAWGMAILAAYRAWGGGEPLEGFLSARVFAEGAGTLAAPDPEDARGFSAFMDRYMKGLAIERAAVEHMR